MQDLSIPDKHAALYYHIAHIRTFSGIHDMRLWMVYRHQVRGMDINNDQIGLLTDFKGANPAIKTNGSGPGDRRHLNDGFCIHGGWIKFFSLMKFGNHVHFMKQIQIVVAGTSVCTETHDYAGL